MPKKILSQEKM